MRYFFHTEGKERVTDQEGTELPNLNEARAEALRTTGEMLRDAAKAYCDGNMLRRLWITEESDGRGRTLFAIDITLSNQK
jgi:hypothetical protein